MLSKTPNEQCINPVVKYCEHLIDGDKFNFTSVFENSIMNIDSLIS